MFRCPACASRSISAAEKFFATAKAPARCRRCGARLCLAQPSKGRLIASIIVLALLLPAALRVKVPPHLALLMLLLAVLICIPAMALPLRVVQMPTLTPLQRWRRKALRLALAVGLVGLVLAYMWTHLAPAPGKL